MNFRACSLAVLLCLPAAFSQQATSNPPAKDKVVLRSGQVTMCHIKKGCEEETMGGRRYLVMKSDGLLLKVTTGQDPKLGYADVTITNESGEEATVNPAEFRMELSEPKLKRLNYVDPSHVATPEAAKAKDPELGHGLPPPSYWTSSRTRTEEGGSRGCRSRERERSRAAEAGKDRSRRHGKRARVL